MSESKKSKTKKEKFNNYLKNTNNEKNFFSKILSKFSKKVLIIFSFGFVGVLVTISIVVIGVNNKQDKYTENKICSIIFDTNGALPIEPVNLKCGETVKQPNIPEKKGFIFKGWYLDDTKYDFLLKVTRDIILEARWEAKPGVEKITISFDTVGGSVIKPIELVKGDVLLKPINPLLSGYKFLGWFYNYEEFDFNKPIYNSITLKAKWEAKKNSNKEIQTSSSSNKYKCTGSFRKDVPVKNVMVGYSDHVNWTWSTHGAYDGEDGEVCYITYKTSDASIATVNQKGIISTKKAGTAYISECINDSETKKEVICFKGKLNIQDRNDTTTVLSEYDIIANKYSGIWYLEGYSDILITISKYKMYYEAMDITPTQIDIINGGIYPNGYGNIQISYENWNSDLKKYNVTLGAGYISIKTPVSTYKFTKTKGTKNKYSNSKFYEAIGTWYLYNKPEANFEIYKTGDDSDPKKHAYYCITPNSFDFVNLKYINASGGSLGCGSGTNNEILDKYGIKISNGEMTITNSKGSVKLYKTKKIISVNNVSLNKNNLTLNIGETETLTYSISPSNSYNQDVSWSSSDSSVAKVNSSGKITAISKGTTIIKIITKDGSKIDSCEVNVKAIDVTGITLNNNTLNLVHGNSANLVATILPNNATNKNISWSSSDSSVATVNSSGKVIAIKKGTTIITATTSDGSYTAKCIVSVSNPELTAKGSIGIRTTVSSSGATRGIFAEINASGGTGTYTYYYIKIYKNGTLIASTTNTSSNELFIVGHTNGSYTMKYEVRDSDGTIKTGTSTTTISGF